MARQLETLGVDVIEAGFPAASDGDFQSVVAIAATVTKPIVTALCRALPSDIDRGFEAIKDAARKRIHTFIATSELHMTHKLGKTPEQVLDMLLRYSCDQSKAADAIETACAKVLAEGYRTADIMGGPGCLCWIKMTLPRERGPGDSPPGGEGPGAAAPRPAAGGILEWRIVWAGASWL